MEIEVGKAYRTRGGWKAVVVARCDVDSFSVNHGKDRGEWFHEAEGRWAGSDPKYRDYDLIAEWTDEPAAPKYRAGDHITFKIDSGDAKFLNDDENRLRNIELFRHQLISHTPAPFDWKDVKPGMAFKHMAGEDIWIYSGPWIRQEASGIYTTAERRGFFQELGSLCNATDISFSALTRAPEHDIEVKS